MCKKMPTFINFGAIQRATRVEILKVFGIMLVISLVLMLILSLILKSFYECEGAFGDTVHLDLRDHPNYDRLYNGKCIEEYHGEEDHKFPFIARFVVVNDTEKFVFCSGSLISDDIVVTAAHCLAGITYAKLEVHVGTASNIEKFINFTEKDIKIHSKYDSKKFTNDIALIRLNRKFDPSTISTLCIPFDDEIIRKNLTMGEWDVEKIRINDPKIIETTVNGIDNLKCGEYFHNLVEVVQQTAPSNEISELNKKLVNKNNQKEVRFEQFCTEKKSVTPGNSGMPVYGNDLKTGAPTIYGFVSFGVKKEFGEDLPTVLTRIYDYRHWILCHSY
ncbi:unnamed protein product [Chironomus riparius]|uniref:Peptidase S1 domain-containing protein n=1 Tax=Chironomus riparius TaxID=315576 RepID=A0A9N9S7P5_9DIPT|nr:unnamed protein product [Chironomus riparius]